jgi:hypothetical protein
VSACAIGDEHALSYMSSDEATDDSATAQYQRLDFVTDVSTLPAKTPASILMNYHAGSSTLEGQAYMG